MLLLNLSHPLASSAIAEIEALAGQAIDRVLAAMPQIDLRAGLAVQMAKLVQDLGLSVEEWQSLPIVVILPGFAPAAAALVAELHGRMGHFPTIAYLRPAPGSTPTVYEVAELVNLQSIREAARLLRQDQKIQKE
jgi:hypothetical protein